MKLTKSTRIIFLTIFIDLLGFGIIIPILAPIASQYLPDRWQGPGVAALMAGFSLLQMIFSPIWGRFSDRHGRRPVLLISLAGSTLSYFIFAFSHSFTLLLASRLFAGLCGGNVTAAQAFMADVTSEKERTQGMGLIGMAFGLGFALGPVAGGFASWLAARFAPASTPQFGPGLLAGCICLANLLWACARLPESLPPEKRGQNRFRRFATAREAAGVLRSRPLGALILFFFFATFAFSNFEVSFSLFTRKVLGPPILSSYIAASSSASGAEAAAIQRELDQTPALRKLMAGAQALEKAGRNAGPVFLSVARELSSRPRGAAVNIITRHVYHYFLFIGVMMALVQGWLLRKLTKRFNDASLMVAGSVIMTAGLLILPQVEHEYWMLLPLAILSLGNGIAAPAVMSLISRHAAAGSQGNTLGTSQSASALARIAGPAMAGPLFAFDPRAPFWAAAAVMAFTAWSGAIVWKNLKRAETAQSAAA